jgi:hypothetical protein
LFALFLVEYHNHDLEAHPWYQDIIYYLKFQRCLDNLKYHKCRRTQLEASKYLILSTSLFHRTVDKLLLCCVNDTVAQKILKQINGSTDSNIHIGGHFVAKVTTHKILRTGYYSPLVFRDSYKFLQPCIVHQKFDGKEKFFVIPLQSVLPYFHFSKWGLDFIGPTNPSSFVSHIFILTKTDYFTKWTKVVPLRHAQDEQVIPFLESNIFYCFGLPIKIISDNGPLGQHLYLEN